MFLKVCCKIFSKIKKFYYHEYNIYLMCLSGTTLEDSPFASNGRRSVEDIRGLVDQLLIKEMM